MEPKTSHIKVTSDSTIPIDIGYKENLNEKGYYVLFENIDNTWIVNKISKTPITRRPNEKFEILFFNNDLTYAQPIFEKVEFFNGGTFDCTLFFDEYKNLYTPCTSNLMSANIPMTIGKNIIAIPFSLGTAIGHHAQIDRAKISNLIESSYAFDIIESQKQFLDAEYEHGLAMAKKLYEAQKRKAAEQKHQEKLEELPYITKIGTYICKDIRTRLGDVRYHGYTEQVADNRIQVRVANATFVGSPHTVGGFKPNIIWDDPFDWSVCR